MYINNGKDPSVFLDEVHDKMIQQYTINNGVLGSASVMAAKADKIEKFLQGLKTAATSGGTIENALYQAILTDVQTLSHSGTKMTKFFRRGSGISFEKELSKVVMSVMSRATETALSDIDMGRINIGQKNANINIGDQFFTTDIVQHILEAVGTQTTKNLQNQFGQKQKYLIIKGGSGKPDVAGYQIQGEFNPPSELKELYELFSEASFSAKNYGAKYWDRQAKKLLDSTELRLGNTNIFKVYYGVLSDLGYNKTTIISSFKRILQQKDNAHICKRINQIRFVYELAGVGLSYTNYQSLKGEANYFVWNDPQGKIYVRSTAQMIADLIENLEMINAGNPFDKYDTMYISKQYFHGY